MAAPLTQRILDKLSAQDSAELAEGARALTEHLLSQRLRALVAPDELLPIVLASLTRDNLARDVTRHVQPGVQRYSAVVAQAPERVADLVSPEVIGALREQLERPTGARARWLKGAVDPALLKRLLAPVWIQLLVSFAKRIPIPGLGATSAAGGAPATSAPGSASRGIASMLGRSVQQSAERLVGAGRSALEGLGIDVEKKLQSAAREFSDGALNVWNQALRERLQSPEGKAIVTQIKHGVLEHVLGARLRDIDRDAVALPLAPYIDLAPAVIAHAAQVPWVRSFIESELAAYFALEGERRLDELLGELGVLEPARAWLQARLETQLAGYCRSDAFAAWLGKLVEPAGAEPA